MRIEFILPMHIFTKNVCKIGITRNLNRIRPAEISNKDENENLIIYAACICVNRQNLRSFNKYFDL